MCKIRSTGAPLMHSVCWLQVTHRFGATCGLFTVSFVLSSGAGEMPRRCGVVAAPPTKPPENKTPRSWQGADLCPSSPRLCEPFHLPPQHIAIAYHGEYLRVDEMNKKKKKGHCSNFFLDWPNQCEHIFEPLRAAGINVSVFFHTVRGPCGERDDLLIKTLRPHAYEFADKRPNFIVDSYIAVLKLIMKAKKTIHIDAIILLRFDVQYRLSILSEQFQVDWRKTNFAFRDIADQWIAASKVSDLFHVLPIAHAKPLLDVLIRSQNRREQSFGRAVHFVYPPLIERIGEVNTCFIAPVCKSSNNGLRYTANTTFIAGIDRSCNRTMC